MKIFFTCLMILASWITAEAQSWQPFYNTNPRIYESTKLIDLGPPHLHFRIGDLLANQIDSIAVNGTDTSVFFQKILGSSYKFVSPYSNNNALCTEYISWEGERVIRRPNEAFAINYWGDTIRLPNRKTLLDTIWKKGDTSIVAERFQVAKLFDKDDSLAKFRLIEYVDTVINTASIWHEEEVWQLHKKGYWFTPMWLFFPYEYSALQLKPIGTSGFIKYGSRDDIQDFHLDDKIEFLEEFRTYKELPDGSSFDTKFVSRRHLGIVKEINEDEYVLSTKREISTSFFRLIDGGSDSELDSITVKNDEKQVVFHSIQVPTAALRMPYDGKAFFGIDDGVTLTDINTSTVSETSNSDCPVVFERDWDNTDQYSYEIIRSRIGRWDYVNRERTFSDASGDVYEYYRFQVTYFKSDSFSLGTPGKPIGIYETVQGVSARVFPNPSSGSYHVQASSPIVSLYIYNVHGQLLQANSGEYSNNLVLDLSSWQSGIYLLRVETKDGVIQSRIIRK